MTASSPFDAETAGNLIERNLGAGAYVGETVLHRRIEGAQADAAE